MMIVAVVLGGLGFVSLLFKRNIIGLLIGVHLVLLGGLTSFAAVGVNSGALDSGQIVALFIAISGIGQIAAGCALAIRVFYLRKNQGIESLESLKH